jgi:hypothetical protein
MAFEFDYPDDTVRLEMGVLVLSGWDDGGGAATNRLLFENGDGLLLEDSSGDLALD